MSKRSTSVFASEKEKECRNVCLHYRKDHLRNEFRTPTYTTATETILIPWEILKALPQISIVDISAVPQAPPLGRIKMSYASDRAKNINKIVIGEPNERKVQHHNLKDERL